MSKIAKVLQTSTRAIFLAMLMVAFSSPATAQDKALDDALAMWGECLTGYIDTHFIKSPDEPLISESFSACVADEQRFNSAIGKLSDNPDQSEVVTARKQIRDQFASALTTRLTELQLQREPAILWKGLKSGMAEEQVVSALAADGIRARTKSNKYGSIYVDVEDTVDVAGIRATVEPEFVNGRLFRVRLVAEPAFSSSSEFFLAWQAALTQKYGQSRSEHDTEITSESRVATTTHKSVSFLSGPVLVELILNEVVPSGELSARGSRPTSYLIVNYWRDVDAQQSRASEQRRRERDQAATAEKNSTNF